METFLQRYMAGEHQQVWQELLARGEQVREEPLYSDALAVARETMRRARRNIEMLVERLTRVGFQFGPYEWDLPSYAVLREKNPDWQDLHPATFAPPKPSIQEQIEELEQFGGPLPLSLRAWYEHIGSVCLVGDYPVETPADPGGFTNWVQFNRATRAHPKDARPAELWSHENRHELDPLYVNPIEAAISELRNWDQIYADPQRHIEIAPDEYFKCGVSGGGVYVIRLPNSAADASLEREWHHTTFVNYLRTCFRWGGFPGLETKRCPPLKELAYLTEGLEPL